HTASTAIADQFGLVKLVNAAHWLFPKMAAVQIEIPIQIEIFVPAEATKFFRLAPQVPLHFVERFSRIDYREMASSLHLFDLLKDLDEFLGFVGDQVGIAEA